MYRPCRCIAGIAALSAALIVLLGLGIATVDAQRTPPENAAEEATLEVQTRSRTGGTQESGSGRSATRDTLWKPSKTAIIVCDMWDDHTCQGAARRVAEMAPAMNETLKAARKNGVLIIHAPSGRTGFYADTPQRRQALEAPAAQAPVEIKWNYWDTNLEGNPFTEIVDGGCACPEPCPNFVEDEQGIRHWKEGGQIPWTRQIETIDIAASDAISDNGQEIYNLLQDRDIKNVVLMGVHTNICVSGRPFGLRQMVYFGKNVVLCRDLTDSLFQATAGELDHFQGTDLIVQHIEQNLCPTITSTVFTGQKEFRFKDDKAGEKP